MNIFIPVWWEIRKARIRSRIRVEDIFMIRIRAEISEDPKH